jgi:hypothetical protein
MTEDMLVVSTVSVTYSVTVGVASCLAFLGIAVASLGMEGPRSPRGSGRCEIDGSFPLLPG